MRWNDTGFGRFEVVTIVAFLIIIAAIVIPNLSRKATPDVELRGWVRNASIISDTTYVAFEKEGNITPQSYTLVGKHPELWRGEHIWLRLHPRPLGDRYEIVGFVRLGPDASDKSERSPSSP